MKAVSIVCQVVGALALSVLLFATGYFACSQPITTNVLSQSTSTFEQSPYALDDLTTLAVATRDLTVNPRDVGTSVEDVRKTFNETLMLAATHSSDRYLNSTKPEDAKKTELWQGLFTSLEASTPAELFTLENVNATAESMAEHSEAFALTTDAFEHLDDCNFLINTALAFIIGALIVFILCSLVLLVLRQWAGLGHMFVIAPIVLLLVFLALTAWAVLDFHGFFAAFHALLFPQGNWTFASDSLLITMLPTGFWMAMGIIWVITSVLASALAIMFGRWLARFQR